MEVTDTLCDPNNITLASVSELLDKWNHFFIGGRFNKILVREFRTDLDNFKKDFSVNPTFFIIQLELVCICVFDLLDGVPELMHIDFRNFSSDQESEIACREFKSIQSNLICGLLNLNLALHFSIFSLFSGATNALSRAIC
ncbi:hypothetical protein Tco_0231035, partial [Tanacetum coccineum]